MPLPARWRQGPGCLLQRLRENARSGRLTARAAVGSRHVGTVHRGRPLSVAIDLTEALRRWIADELGDPQASISGVRRTSAGFSRENWVFDASWTEAGQPRTAALIARRDPEGSVLDTDRRVETRVLAALETTSVPSPRLRWADLDGRRLGRPAIVMDVAEGVCDGFVLAGDAPAAERLRLAHELYDRLADIHLLDWRALGLADVLDDPGDQAAPAALAHWESELRRVQLEPEPELELVMHWLRAHAPRNAVTTLVHGDFKAGNVLLVGDLRADVGSAVVSAVLDWETVHLGDPREDLGWVTNPLRAREHSIPGTWEPADLLARWSERTGMTAEPEAVHWWSVLANLKLSAIVLSGAHAFVNGRLDRVHQAPIGIYRLMLDMIGA
jgi:aminoglycoside phosphotransferase (APT) family kinase protein